MENSDRFITDCAINNVLTEMVQYCDSIIESNENAIKEYEARNETNKYGYFEIKENVRITKLIKLSMNDKIEQINDFYRKENYKEIFEK